MSPDSAFGMMSGLSDRQMRRVKYANAALTGIMMCPQLACIGAEQQARIAWDVSDEMIKQEGQRCT